MVVRPGRPPSEETRSAILESALALLCEVGYPGMTMDAIAERAGSSKATIYRHWPCKADLVVAALTAHVQPFTIERTGDLRTDLVAMLREFIAQITTTCLGDVIATIAEACTRDPQLDAVMAPFRERRKAPTIALLTEARERGAIRPDIDILLAGEMLCGPIFFRLLVAHEPVTPDLAEQLVDMILPGIQDEHTA